MYYIKQSEWNNIPNDYKGTSMEDKSIRVVFEGSIPGNKGKGGTTLLFEHKHFEIVSDSKGNIDMDKFSSIDDTLLHRRLDEINGEFQDLHISTYRSNLLTKERDEIKAELQKRGYTI